MEKKLKLKAWIKNQKNCINFTQNTLSDMGEAAAAKSNTLPMKMGAQKLIGGLKAYQKCYELFYNTPPAATLCVGYSDNLPNGEGWYWMRTPSGFEAIKRVFMNHFNDLCTWTTDVHGGLLSSP